MSLEHRTLTIGWIGTGVMGEAMAGHLLNAGHTLRVYTRTKSKAQALIDRGATWADTPADAAHGADVACSIVGYPNDVRDVHLGSNGALSAARPPRIIIDFTTSRPSLAVEIAERAAESGIGSIDAPVSGGDIGARNGSLSIMVGGEAQHVEHVRPILDCVGSTIIHQGPPGAGQHTKMVNQILIASTMIGVCEGLRYAQHAGLDPMQVIQSVGVGAAGSWSINNLGPRIIAGDFRPGFFIEHFVKDLGIALEEAERMSLNLPGLRMAKELYDRLIDMGHGRLGTQALMLTYDESQRR